MEKRRGMVEKVLRLLGLKPKESDSTRNTRQEADYEKRIVGDDEEANSQDKPD